jgi:hypothetical protein
MDTSLTEAVNALFIFPEVLTLRAHMYLYKCNVTFSTLSDLFVLLSPELRTLRDILKFTVCSGC